MAPRPFLVSGGSEDPPERWRALNHAVAVNKLLGYEDRVAMTNRPGHDPTDGVERADLPVPGARPEARRPPLRRARPPCSGDVPHAGPAEGWISGHVPRPEDVHGRARGEDRHPLAPGRGRLPGSRPATRRGARPPGSGGRSVPALPRDEHAVREVVEVRPEGPLRAARADPLGVQPIVDRSRRWPLAAEARGVRRPPRRRRRRGTTAVGTRSRGGGRRPARSPRRGRRARCSGRGHDHPMPPVELQPAEEPPFHLPGPADPAPVVVEDAPVPHARPPLRGGDDLAGRRHETGGAMMMSLTEPPHEDKRSRPTASPGCVSRRRG